MSLSAEIRQQLAENAAGLTRKQLFEGCKSADDERNFAALLSTLKLAKKIKIAGERMGEAYYQLGHWPSEMLRENLVKNGGQKDQTRESPRPEAPPAQPRTKEKNVVAPIPGVRIPQKIDARFFVGDNGELTIKKGEMIIELNRDEHEKLREFEERTEDAWKPQR